MSTEPAPNYVAALDAKIEAAVAEARRQREAEREERRRVQSARDARALEAASRKTPEEIAEVQRHRRDGRLP